MGTKYDVLSGTGTFDGYQAQGKGDGRIYMFICKGRLAGAVLSGLIFLSLFIHACIYIYIYIDICLCCVFCCVRCCALLRLELEPATGYQAQGKGKGVCINLLCFDVTGTGTCDGFPCTGQMDGRVYILRLGDRRERALIRRWQIHEQGRPAHHWATYCLFDSAISCFCLLSIMCLRAAPFSSGFIACCVLSLYDL